MAGRLILPLAEPVFNANGLIQAGATLTVYQNRTTTPATIYLDKGLTTPATNPQTANAAGLFYAQGTLLWADDTKLYSVKLQLPNGGPAYTYDDLSPLSGAALTSVLQITYGSGGNLTVTAGDPASGPGGNAFDGGILTHQAVGDYQVAAYQIHATSGLMPTWGPRAELVITATYDQSTNFNRVSFTEMADWAGPALNDAAADIRIQQEAAGTEPVRDIKLVSQRNDGGNPLVEWFDARGDNFSTAPTLQFFRRTDSPAPAGDLCKITLKQERRTLSPVLTAAGQQNSPTLEIAGAAYDSNLHFAQWRLQTRMESNAGVSRLTISTAIDSASDNDILDIHDDGRVVINGSVSSLCLGGSTSIGTGNANLFSMKNVGVFGAAATDCANLGVSEISDGHARWYAKGEDGFEGYVMLNSGITSVGADGTGTTVRSANGSALTPNDGFLTLQAQDSSTVYVPFWHDITP